MNPPLITDLKTFRSFGFRFSGIGISFANSLICCFPASIDAFHALANCFSTIALLSLVIVSWIPDKTTYPSCRSVKSSPLKSSILNDFLGGCFLFLRNSSSPNLRRFSYTSLCLNHRFLPIRTLLALSVLLKLSPQLLCKNKKRLPRCHSYFRTPVL